MTEDRARRTRSVTEDFALQASHRLRVSASRFELPLRSLEPHSFQGQQTATARVVGTQMRRGSNIVDFLRQLRIRLGCLFKGHRLADSRSRPGYRRCIRCQTYRKV